MARPRKHPSEKLVQAIGLVSPQCLENVDILASREGVARSEIVRYALTALTEENPIDDVERSRWRKLRTEQMTCGHVSGLRRPSGTVARVETESSEKPTSGIEPLTDGLRKRTFRAAQPNVIRLPFLTRLQRAVGDR